MFSETDGDHALKPGQLNHRMLLVVTSDFYRPFSVAEIHAGLYPGEFYNPRSSPARVHQAVRAFRLWLRESGLPLALSEDGGRYSLQATAPCVVYCPRPGIATDNTSVLLNKLAERWPDQPFTAGQAGKLLGLSPRRTLSYLQAAVADGRLSRVGRGRATRYRRVAR